jgi:pyruvate kinase
LREGFGRVGENITISAGVPFGESGSTNLLHIATLR